MVLNLDDRHVGSVRTPAPISSISRFAIPSTQFDRSCGVTSSVLPLCDGALDRVLGFVRSTNVLAQVLEKGAIELPSLAEAALFVPETMTLMKLLEQFKRTHLPPALVVDEFGDVEGLVSLTDVISAIV